jgi:adenylate cyclase
MSKDPIEAKSEPISTNNIVDMMLGAGRSDALDTESLIKQTQKRVWSSLKKGYEYDYSIDESEKFLRSHVDMKLHMIIIFVDIVGSTEMTLQLPAEKLAIILSSFSQEMRYVIKHHDGYVLKYVGDAVIGYFVTENSPLLIADNAVNCARTMIDVIERGINPILTEYDYPEIRAKIGMDFGENTIVRYGSDQTRSHVDILGPAMSIAAKITNLARPNQILIGEDVYDKLHPSLKQSFKEVEWHGDQWNYHDRETGKLYRVYALVD